MRRASAAILALLVIGFGLASLPLASQTHANYPSCTAPSGLGFSAASGASSSYTFPVGINFGAGFQNFCPSLVLMFLTTNSHLHVVSISGAIEGSWTERASKTYGGLNMSEWYLKYSTDPPSEATTITLNASGVQGIYISWIQIWKYYAAQPYDYYFASPKFCTSATGTLSCPTTTLGTTAGEVLVLNAAQYCPNTITSTIPWTIAAGWGGGSCSGSGPDASYLLYNQTTHSNSNVATSFISSGSPLLAMQDVVAAGPSQPGVFVTQTVPCSFFSEQCWVYPLMALGMIDGVFLTVAGVFRTSEKGTLYLLLTGSTYAGLAEIQLGIMTPLVPIMLVVLVLAYSFRLDRLIVSAAEAVRR